jgi:hypothetical protein
MIRQQRLEALRPRLHCGNRHLLQARPPIQQKHEAGHELWAPH